MKTLMLLVSAFLLISSSLFSSAFAKEENKDEVKSVSSKIQYVGEDSNEPEPNDVYSGSNPINRYGGFPSSYGPFMGPREIVRNRFRGSDGNSNDENRDNESRNDESTGGSSFQYPGTTGIAYPYPGNSVSSYPYPGSDGSSYPYPSTGGSNYPYPGIGGGSYPYLGTGGNRYPYPGAGGSSSPYPGTDGPEEEANGVFSNPFLGQRRRTSSTTPDYDNSEDGGQTGYERPSLGGSYRPSYGRQPGIYSSSPGGYRPQGDQGYIYPLGGNGIGLRQPNGAYGLGTGNGYGVYPGTFRNVPVSYVPTSGINGVYTGNPRSYGPELFGYGRYPGLLYPGLGLDYGRLRASESHGVKGKESVDRKSGGLPRAESTPTTKEAAEGKKTNPLRKEDP